MIKPLLRTIPTMSGNVKLACTLLDYNKIKEDVSLSAKSLSRLIGFSQRTVEREISFLRNNGFIDKTTKERPLAYLLLFCRIKVLLYKIFFISYNVKPSL